MTFDVLEMALKFNDFSGPGQPQILRPAWWKEMVSIPCQQARILQPFQGVMTPRLELLRLSWEHIHRLQGTHDYRGCLAAQWPLLRGATGFSERLLPIILRATPSAAGPFWLLGVPSRRLGASILTFWETILAPRAPPG